MESSLHKLLRHLRIQQDAKQLLTEIAAHRSDAVQVLCPCWREKPSFLVWKTKVILALIEQPETHHRTSWGSEFFRGGSAQVLLTAPTSHILRITCDIASGTLAWPGVRRNSNKPHKPPRASLREFIPIPSETRDLIVSSG